MFSALQCQRWSQVKKFSLQRHPNSPLAPSLSTQSHTICSARGGQAPERPRQMCLDRPICRSSFPATKMWANRAIWGRPREAKSSSTCAAWIFWFQPKYCSAHLTSGSTMISLMASTAAAAKKVGWIAETPHATIHLVRFWGPLCLEPERQIWSFNRAQFHHKHMRHRTRHWSCFRHCAFTNNISHVRAKVSVGRKQRLNQSFVSLEKCSMQESHDCLASLE